MQRPWRTTFAPILINFSREVVNDQWSTFVGDANFRLWLQADIQSPEIEVRFTPDSRHHEPRQGPSFSGVPKPAAPKRQILSMRRTNRLHLKHQPIGINL